MKYSKLDRSQLEIAKITFGSWELGGGQWEKESDEINIQAIQRAYDLGIHTFDTAEGYGNGHSETIVGLALEGKRKECVIATKVAPNHLKAADVRVSAENSLKRLRTDYIDLLYIHWPNNEVPLEETLAEFNKLKEEKLIRAIGLSNFSLGLLQQAVQLADIDAIQPEYSLLHRGIEAEILPYCIENKIAVMTYSSIAKGILTGVYHFGNAVIKDNDFRRERRLFLPDHLEKETELVQLVKEIAEARGVTMSEVAIAWLLQQKGVTSAIVGTQKLKHLEENIRAVDLLLTGDEINRLSEVSTRVIASIDN